MKKLLLAAALAGFVFTVQPVAPAQATATLKDPAKEWCKARDNLGMGKKMCKLFYKAQNGDIKAEAKFKCQRIADRLGGYPNARFEKKKDCEKYFKSILG